MVDMVEVSPYDSRIPPLKSMAMTLNQANLSIIFIFLIRPKVKRNFKFYLLFLIDAGLVKFNIKSCMFYFLNF